MNNLTVRLETPKDKAQICCDAVGIEAKSEALTRSGVKLCCEGDELVIDIRAQDLSSMRAALNTYLRWVNMCCDLVEEKNK